MGPGQSPWLPCVIRAGGASLFGSSTIAKIPCSSLRSYAATYFPFSSTTSCNVCTKKSQMHFKKVRLACKMMAQQLESTRPDSHFGSYSYRHLVDESRNRSGIRSLSVFGFTSPPMPFCMPSFRLSSKNVRPTYDAFAKRMFSAKVVRKSGPSATSTGEAMFAKRGKDGRNVSKSYHFNKNRKRVKTLATQGGTDNKPAKVSPSQLAKKGTEDSRVSTKKKVNAINTNEAPAEDGPKKTKSLSSTKVDNKQKSNTEAKTKQQTRSKIKKEGLSDTISSSDAVKAKGSKRVNNVNGQSPHIAENRSAGNIIKEETELSHSTAVVPKKKTSKSKKKVKSSKEVDVEKKTNGALPKPRKSLKKVDVEEGKTNGALPKRVKPLKKVDLDKKTNGALPKQGSSLKKVDVQEEKTNGALPKRGKPLEKEVVEEKTNGSLPKKEDAEQAPSKKNLSPEPIPLTVNGIKSIKLKPLYPPVGKSVVVVESVTKARVIQGYLGDMYEVLPSYGHVRDLAARSGSVRPDDDFSMVWEVPSAAWNHLKSMKVAVSGADNLILASDPDREGEAIAWHIIEMLQQQKALREDITVARVVFQEITESAIKSALQTPRDIDVNLVHAYLGRRALDYLIGFNISPLLWRKLPGCQSAGRVQSAALSLICDREMEIEEFKPQEYWTVEAIFNYSNVSSLVANSSLRSHLTHFDSQKLNQLSVGSESEAKNIEQLVRSSHFKVTGAKRTKVNRKPPTPYITSTLQQDAANKLRFSAAYTMQLAQRLYEGIQLSDGKSAGLITYMRTDGLHISDEAVKKIHSLITERYGSGFAASSPRKFLKKVKNAQEAHEAIRPTDVRRFPSMLVGALDADSLKLYTLIWARTMACQMEAAIVEQIQLDVGNDEGSISFRAACSTIAFPGFRSVYEDVETQVIRDTENEATDREELHKILSSLKLGDPLCLGNLELKQHHTQPPPRYSEASLVKKLEELGIGRPSTYASTIKVLQDRKYVLAKSRVLYPEFRGRMVSAFLSHYFTEVTDYSFTADMESELDNVSGGSTEWKGLLKDYWSRFSTYCDRASKVHIHQVEKMLERTYGNFLFSFLPDENRTCPSCMEGTLIFKVSRFGAGYFIGCDQHPQCKYIAKTLYGEEEDDEAPQSKNIIEEPKLLGTHPVSGEKILMKHGPYGSYVQLGEDRKGYSPKRASISQIKDANSVNLEEALDFLRYPITLGTHPVDGQPVTIKIAKQGFTIRHRRNIAPVPKSLNPHNIDMDKAVELLSGDDVRRCGRPKGPPKRKDEVMDDI